MNRRALAFEIGFLLVAFSSSGRAQVLDCNANGIPDATDLSAGTSRDCNGNEIPDECDVAITFGLSGKVSIPLDVTVHMLEAGDLDGDGDNDLMGSTGTTLLRISNSGGRSFWVDELEVFNGNQLTLGDMERDGDLDLVVASNEEQTDIAVLRNRGNGSFGVPEPYSAPGSAFVSTADLDGDASLDLVGTAHPSHLYVCINDGAGKFPSCVQYDVGNLGNHVYADDFDGDGDLDLVDTMRAVGILLNNGSGSFAPVNRIIDQGHIWDAGVADFDGDGVVDLVLMFRESERQGAGKIVLYRNSGTASFSPVFEQFIGNMPRSISTGDLDSDGFSDVAVTNDQLLGTLSVHLNRGNGTFEDLPEIAIGSQPYAVRFADLGSNGRIDIAVSNRSESQRRTRR